MKMEKKPQPPRRFERGPSTIPSAGLLSWLEGESRRSIPRLIRLPLILNRGAAGFSLRGARIGPAADAIEVYANDSALGVGLDDRARRSGEEKTSCAFWVDAYWRGEQGEPGFRIDVVNVVSLIDEAALGAANYVEAEDESQVREK